VSSTIFKADARASQRVLNRARDQNLTRSGLRSYAGTSVDRDTANRVSSRFTFAQVKPGSDLNTELAN
jgi:hypothetical protein